MHAKLKGAYLLNKRALKLTLPRIRCMAVTQACKSNNYVLCVCTCIRVYIILVYVFCSCYLYVCVLMYVYVTPVRKNGFSRAQVVTMVMHKSACICTVHNVYVCYMLV